MIEHILTLAAIVIPPVIIGWIAFNSKLEQ